MKKILIALFVSAGIAAYARNSENTVYMAANAHLDTQWNWNIQKTIGEFLPNTLRQNFALMEAFPDYKFSFEGAVKYYWFKEYYPEQFKMVREYVSEGRWYPAGDAARYFERLTALPAVLRKDLEELGTRIDKNH